MSEHYDHGPLQTYEITWKSGHIETIQAHSFTTRGDDPGSFASAMFGVAVKADRDPRVQFHGEFDGHWRLVLSALEQDIATIRLLPVPEQLPTSESAS